MDFKYYIQKIVARQITKFELEEFEEKFLDSDNEQIIKHEMKLHLSKLREEDMPSFPKLDYLYEAVRNRIKQKDVSEIRKVRLIFIQKWMKFAAIICIGMIIGVLVKHQLIDEYKNYNTIIASQKGSITKTTLPDGTIVSLNSDSRLIFDPSRWEKKRNVKLIGEGWFDVRSDKKKPFTVHTKYYDVIVTGTKFNIKAYGGQKESITTLAEGRVMIQLDEKPYGKGIELRPGQQYIFNSLDENWKIKNVIPKLYSSWRNSKLIFINMKFKEMIESFEHKFGIQIVVLDEELLNYHYDGTFENESLIEVLELLKMTLPIQYSFRGEEVVIQKRD